MIQYRNPQNYDIVLEALKKAGRMDLVGYDKHCLLRPKRHGGKNQGTSYSKSRAPEWGNDSGHRNTSAGNASGEKRPYKRKQSVTYTKRKADDPMKIALVTGASPGMGREFARQIVKLYRNLDEIWLVARRTERLQELEKEFTVPVRIFDGDLNRDYIYERIEKSWNVKMQRDPDTLLPARRCGLSGCFGEGEQDTELRMVKLNCQSLTRMLLLCRPFLGRGSRVINLASAAAFAPQPGFAIYAASKSYVYRLSMAIREEWKPAEISVTVVCPGPVDTEFFCTAVNFLEKVTKLQKHPKAVVRKALLMRRS